MPTLFRAWQDAMRAYPDARVFVGQVRPIFENQPLRWLEDRPTAACPVRLRLSCSPSAPCDPAYTKGLNWAVRRSALGSALFDEENNNLLRGGMAVGGQDIEMARRLVRRGNACVYVADAVAEHIVREQQTTLSAVFKRYRRIGRGVAAQGH